jgi:hypothetical protein
MISGKSRRNEVFAQEKGSFRTFQGIAKAGILGSIWSLDKATRQPSVRMKDTFRTT